MVGKVRRHNRGFFLNVSKNLVFQHKTLRSEDEHGEMRGEEGALGFAGSHGQGFIIKASWERHRKASEKGKDKEILWNKNLVKVERRKERKDGKEGGQEGGRKKERTKEKEKKETHITGFPSQRKSTNCWTGQPGVMGSPSLRSTSSPGPSARPAASTWLLAGPWIQQAHPRIIGAFALVLLPAAKLAPSPPSRPCRTSPSHQVLPDGPPFEIQHTDPIPSCVLFFSTALNI